MTTGHEAYRVFAHGASFCGTVRIEAADARVGRMRRRLCGMLEVVMLTAAQGLGSPNITVFGVAPEPAEAQSMAPPSPRAMTFLRV